MRSTSSSLLRLLLLVATLSLTLLVGSARGEDVETEIHIENVVPLYSYSLQSPYIEENLNNRWWNFGGDTVVEVNKYVRLTPDRQSKSGWLWVRHPLTSSSWVIEFDFQVHGGGGTLFGDGFAFWYTVEKEQFGPVFGSKDEFTGLGLFFDTYSNGKHRHLFPYLTAMVGDGKTKYDHENDGKSNEIGGCAADFRGKDFPTKAKVKYVRDGYLQVQTNIKGNDEWEDCFLVHNVTLPPMGYIGFSAHTGDVSDQHDILRVIANGIVNPDKSGDSEKPKPKIQGRSGGKSSWGFFAWLIISIVFVIVGYAGYVAYMQSRKKNSKRF